MKVVLLYIFSLLVNYSVCEFLSTIETAVSLITNVKSLIDQPPKEEKVDNRPKIMIRVILGQSPNPTNPPLVTFYNEDWKIRHSYRPYGQADCCSYMNKRYCNEPFTAPVAKVVVTEDFNPKWLVFRHVNPAKRFTPPESTPCIEGLVISPINGAFAGNTAVPIARIIEICSKKGLIPAQDIFGTPDPQLEYDGNGNVCFRPFHISFWSRTDGLIVDYEYMTHFFTFEAGKDYGSIKEQLFGSVEVEQMCQAVRWVDPAWGLVSEEPMDNLKVNPGVDLNALHDVMQSFMDYFEDRPSDGRYTRHECITKFE